MQTGNKKMTKYLKVTEVAKRYGVEKSTIWRWRKDKPDFPQPKKFSAQTLRWDLAELEAYDEKAEAA